MGKWPATAYRGVVAFSVAVIVASAGCGSDSTGSRTAAASFEAALFRDPPRALAPRIRVWWPGGAVDDPVVSEELRLLADAGYGGVELQTLTLGMSLADIAADSRIRSVGTDPYLAHLRHFAAEAHRLGLAWDLTLGSGWPNGGPGMERQSERQLLMATVRVAGPQTVSTPLPLPEEPSWVELVNRILPGVGPFDQEPELVGVLAAPLIDPSASPPVLGDPTDLSALVTGGTIEWQAPAGEHLLIALYANRVSHFVLGHAYPGEPEAALVLDHLDDSGIDRAIELQGDPWLDALDGSLPDTVFIDSFELVAELPWTESLPERFHDAFGYSLLPYLPFVFRAGGEAKYAEILRTADPPAWASADPEIGVRAREDYEELRAQLFLDEFIDPARRWAESRGVQLRLQAHGGYSDIIDTYAAAHIPESEGLYGRGSFDFLKLAASAAHVAGMRDVSSESFVLTHLLGTSPLSLDELWLLAGRAFAAGITRLVHHGHAYPYERTNGQRWYPFRPGDNAITAGPLPITTDLRPGTEPFRFLPDFNAAQTRIAYAMTRGRHRADVAWLMSARQFRDAPSLINGPLVPEGSEDAFSLALRRRGYVYDRVSRRLLTQSTASNGELRVGKASYRVLLISDLANAEPELMEAIEAAIDGGVPVVVVGDLPRRSSGLHDFESRDAQVVAAAERLRPRVSRVETPEEAARALVASGVLPPLQVSEGTGTLSIEHRDLGGEHLFFLFNESYDTRTWRIQIGAGVRAAQLLDPENGDSLEIAISGAADRPGFTLTLPPARGRILHFES